MPACLAPAAERWPLEHQDGQGRWGAWDRNVRPNRSDKKLRIWFLIISAVSLKVRFPSAAPLVGASSLKVKFYKLKIKQIT